MTARPEFEFVTLACRDKRIGNCPQVADNIPGVVALRDSARPDEVVTFASADWVALVAETARGMGLTA
ncbi:DUF397 domain-containing protein [Kitasatospora sp. NPDC050543]|uniref:DUF397 domain-containing protein n=1 Tax=Kitasatospora sp. NPDC050543 TaxID=3364054 RepID=UPI00378AE16E